MRRGIPWVLLAETRLESQLASIRAKVGGKCAHRLFAYICEIEGVTRF
jgi:hypothetical protein